MHPHHRTKLEAIIQELKDLVVDPGPAQFPKLLYGPMGTTVTVTSPEEEKVKLSDGWTEQPVPPPPAAA